METFVLNLPSEYPSTNYRHGLEILQETHSHSLIYPSVWSIRFVLVETVQEQCSSFIDGKKKKKKKLVIVNMFFFVDVIIFIWPRHEERKEKDMICFFFSSLASAVYVIYWTYVRFCVQFRTREEKRREERTTTTMKMCVCVWSRIHFLLFHLDSMWILIERNFSWRWRAMATRQHVYQPIDCYVQQRKRRINWHRIIKSVGCSAQEISVKFTSDEIILHMNMSPLN